MDKLYLAFVYYENHYDKYVVMATSDTKALQMIKDNFNIPDGVLISLVPLSSKFFMWD